MHFHLEHLDCFFDLIKFYISTWNDFWNTIFRHVNYLSQVNNNQLSVHPKFPHTFSPNVAKVWNLLPDEFSCMVKLTVQEKCKYVFNGYSDIVFYWSQFISLFFIYMFAHLRACLSLYHFNFFPWGIYEKFSYHYIWNWNFIQTQPRHQAYLNEYHLTWPINI